MSVSVESLLKTIDRIYGAVSGAVPWSDVLAEMADHVGGRGATLLRCAKDEKGAVQLNMEGGRLDPAVFRLYEQYFPLDVRYEPISRQLPGMVFTDETIMDRELYRGSQIFNEFFQPCDIPHLIGVNLIHDSDMLAAFTIQGGSRPGPFTRQSATLFDVLTPHLTRAVQLQWQLAEAGRQLRRLQGLVDLVPRPVMLLDGFGNLVNTNAAAEALLRSHDGIRVQRRAVVIGDSAQHRNFLVLLRNAVTCREHVGIEPGGVMQVSRPSGRAPYSVLVAPAPISSDEIGEHYQLAAVFVFDPASRTRPPPEVLGRAFNLSKAESRLVAYLAGGGSLADAAIDLELSVNTLKTQLRSALSRMGLRTQREMISLLENTAASMWKEPE